MRRALWLGYLTIAYNLAEGVVAVYAGSAAGSRALLGFGLDSVVESLSGAVLVWRMRAERRDPTRAEQVERQAVRLIGVAFLALAALVGVESVRSLIGGERPDASTVGIVLTAFSVVVMPWLGRAKRRLAAEMGSRAVEADGKQTMACVYLSAVVLVGLALNAVLGWWWADPLAALGVVGFLVVEGVQAVRAEGLDDCC